MKGKTRIYPVIALAAAVALSLGGPWAYAQVRQFLIGKDLINITSTSNPLPMEIELAAAVLSASNPLPAQLSQGGSALAANNPVPVQLSNGTSLNGAQIPIFTTPGTTTAANATSTSGTVGGTAATVTLTAAANHLIIRNTHASQILYFAVSGTATTSNFAIPAGGEEKVDVPGISTVSLIASGSSTGYSLFAN